MPTLVTDRFGNTVRYTYDSSDKGKLLSIEASDGRALRMEYHPELPHIAAVSDGTRTWRYEYGQVASGRTMLTRVVLPDQSSWQLGGLDGGADHNGLQGLEGLVQMELRYQPDADTPPSRCDEAPAGLDGRTGIGVMVHPSGAVGKFTMQPSSHGRNGVPLACYNNGSVYGAPYFPAFIDSYSLTEKAIWGPGLEPLIWRINYDGTLVSGWSDCSACIAPSVVLATDPKGEVTRYVFGSTFRVDEGLLKQVDIGWRNGAALRSTVTRYDRSFKEPVGTSDQDRGDNWTTTHLLPTDQTRITQQGVTFSWQVPSSGDFDRFARPTRIVRSSSLGTSRTEVTRYADQLQTWMLGQVESVTEAATGQIMEQHSYDARTGSLLTSSRFGLLQSTLTYHPDGMLASSSDGRKQTTSYLDYYRGVPTMIVYADGAIERAAVNEFGRIVTFTDAIGALTRFDYDAMGRFTGVHYPQDGMGWNDTTISFAQSWNEHYDLPAGHWRQDITTGKGRTSNYFDALWRPVYTETYDAADPAASMEVRHHRYDLAGYPSYASYPQRDYSQLGPGVYTSYDALGRTTLTAWNSELGTLYSNKVYGDGFSTTDINARGHSSVSRYQVFDQPTDEALLQSEQPLGVRVDIARDVFGKPLSVSKRGPGASATRNYVYDPNERLCKTVEPETGATVLDYDAADNIAWRAPGTALNALVCDRANVPASARISNSYDSRNRLTLTSFGDGAPAIGRSYWPDGKPNTVDSGGANWTMNYNNRRLPTTQVLALDKQTYTLRTEYDANGFVSEQYYPLEGNPLDIKGVAYMPDALGRPLRASGFANDIRYHPGGAIKSFTYGNGILHVMEPNARQLPALAYDAGILQDRYRYDENGNVQSITDELDNTGSRGMIYDDLNRLSSVWAPKLWGSARYFYDALDNITNSYVGPRNSNYQYNDRNLLETLTSNVASMNLGYRYDARGNANRRGSQVLTFDQGNRLAFISGLESYLYDGFGHRTRTTNVDGAVTLTLYSPAGQLLYTKRSGGPNPPAHTEYIYLHNHQIAEVAR